MNSAGWVDWELWEGFIRLKGITIDRPLHSVHPQYEEMNPIFDTIDYRQHPSIWRAKYYETFFDITETNGRNSRQVYRYRILAKRW